MHTNRRLKKLFIFLLIAIGTLWGDDNVDDDTLEHMSFEELMNVEVSVASRKNEPIFDAPGMVSSYSNTYLQHSGYYTLGKLADITPGYSSTYAFGERGFGTRGIHVSAFNNNRHLVLVDGIPVNHARANKAPTEEELPLLFANRVEFLRGPASSLYGNGAFYGVINVIPQIPETNGTEFCSRMGFGTEQLNRQVIATTAHRSDNYIFQASASYYEKLASETFVGIPIDSNHLYWDDRLAIFLSGSYELTQGPLNGFGAGVVYMSRNTGLGEHWSKDFSHELNNLKWTTFIPYLKYRRSFNEQISTNAYFKYNQSTENGTFVPFNDSLLEIHDGTGSVLNNYLAIIDNYEFFADIQWENPIVDVIFGYNVDWRFRKGISDDPNSKYNDDNGGYGYHVIADSAFPYLYQPELGKKSVRYTTNSVFLQLDKDLPVLEGMLLTGGVRGDFGIAGEEEYSQWSPRISLVQRILPDLNLKAQWATAFAAPGLKEVELNNETISQNPNLEPQIVNLEPETFSSIEVGVVYHPKLSVKSHELFFQVELSGYFNRSKNPLKDSTMTNPENGQTVNFFYNTADTISSSGIESQVRLSTDFGIGFFSNYGFAKAYDLNNREIPDNPRHQIQMGVDWNWEKTGIYGAIVGKNIRGYTTGVNNDKTDHTNFLDLNLGWQSKSGIGLEMQILNLLDGEYHYPSGGNPGIILPRRSATFTLTANF